MDEDQPSAHTGNSSSPVHDSDLSQDPKEQQSFGPWMVVEKKRNRRKTTQKNLQSLSSAEKQSTHSGVNSTSQLTGPKNGSNSTGPGINGKIEAALNEKAVDSNGSVEFTKRLDESLGKNQAQVYNQVSPKNHNKAHSDSLFVDSMQDKSRARKDKIAAHPKGTRGKTISRTSTEQKKPLNNGQNLQDAISPSAGNSSYGSGNLQHDELRMGHFSGQGGQESSSNEKSSLKTSGKGPQPGGRLGSRHDCTEVVQPDSGGERYRPYSFSPTTTRMDSTSTPNSSSRYVHHNEGSMELDGGNHRLGNMGGSDLPSDHNHSTVQSLSGQDLNDGSNENDPSSYPSGGSAMLNESSVHSNNPAVLLPRGQHVDQGQDGQLVSLEAGVR
ncbi:hypothetical protein SLA2020_349690 [Shorea laevis]